jgi:hypothetical protein
MDQLKLLMDYTKFHIGFYLTFAGIGVTLVKLKIITLGILFPSFAGLLIAGVAGGVIGSNIPLYTTFEAFQKDQLGFWGLSIMRFTRWAWLEHLGFWFAILWGITAVLMVDSSTATELLRAPTK